MTALKLVKNGPLAPRKLGVHGLALWRAVNAEYQLEDAGGVELLTGACQALDRAESCREQIDATGEIIKAKTGLREHPLLKHELAAIAFVSRSIARLGLDVEAVRAGPGRPPMKGYEG